MQEEPSCIFSSWISLCWEHRRYENRQDGPCFQTQLQWDSLRCKQRGIYFSRSLVHCSYTLQLPYILTYTFMCFCWNLRSDPSTSSSPSHPRSACIHLPCIPGIISIPHQTNLLYSFTQPKSHFPDHETGNTSFCKLLRTVYIFIYGSPRHHDFR